MKEVWSSEKLGRQVCPLSSKIPMDDRRERSRTKACDFYPCGRFTPHRFLGISHVLSLVPDPGDAETQSLPSTDSVQWG